MYNDFSVDLRIGLVEDTPANAMCTFLNDMCFREFRTRCAVCFHILNTYATSMDSFDFANSKVGEKRLPRLFHELNASTSSYRTVGFLFLQFKLGVSAILVLIHGMFWIF